MRMTRSARFYKRKSKSRKSTWEDWEVAVGMWRGKAIWCGWRMWGWCEQTKRHEDNGHGWIEKDKYVCWCYFRQPHGNFYWHNVECWNGNEWLPSKRSLWTELREGRYWETMDGTCEGVDWKRYTNMFRPSNNHKMYDFVVQVRGILHEFNDDHEVLYGAIFTECPNSDVKFGRNVTG